MEIRPLEPGDLEAVMRLWLDGNREAHPFVPAGYWEDRAAEVREAIARAEVLVCADGGAVRGFAGMQGDYLAGIFVERAARSAGIGRRLLDSLKARHAAITLHVYRKNRRAADFYRREGFTATAEEREADTGETVDVLAWRRSPGREEDAVCPST